MASRRGVWPSVSMRTASRDIADDGVRVVHAVLHASGAELWRRIDGDEHDSAARHWRREHAAEQRHRDDDRAFRMLRERERGRRAR